MRRLLATILVAGLVFAAPAGAGRQHWIGNLDSGGSVNFIIRTKAGHRVVKGFLFDGAKAGCDDGDQTFQNPGLPVGPMAISNGTFRGTVAVTPNGVIKVHGALTNHWQKASGTIKVSGDIGDSPTHRNCTGKNYWHAARK